MTRERELEVSPELLGRLPAELRTRVPTDWTAAIDERSAAAASWRWAKFPTGDEDLSPLCVERAGYRPGRRRRPPAPEGTELVLYGYDERGETTIAIGRGGDGSETEAYLIWRTEHEAVAVEATPARASEIAPGGWWPPRAQGVWRAELDGGRPIRIERFSERGASLERCRWEGDRLVEAITEHGNRPEADGRYVLEWQGSDLVRIERHWAQGEVRVVYERLPRGVTLAGLLSALEDELVERIARCRRARPARARLRDGVRLLRRRGVAAARDHALPRHGAAAA